MITIYIDEAGRWPLAWPVTVGLVVVFSYTKNVKQLLSRCHDSKQLSEKRREILYEELIDTAWIVIVTAQSSAKEIDRYGIIKAQQLAIRRWVKKLSSRRQELYWEVLWTYDITIDGNHQFGLREVLWVNVTTEVKGDARIKEIAAASIAAKVTRDCYMKKISQKRNLSSYWFEQHKWYGTNVHRENIIQYGLSSEHRKSFCSRLVM